MDKQDIITGVWIITWVIWLSYVTIFNNEFIFNDKNKIVNKIENLEKIIVHDTVTIEKCPESKIPSNTKFKISDIVCTWGRKTGIIIDIRISDKSHIPVYMIEWPLSEEENKEFYDTELTLGKCF